jgi:hypothetical protein
MDPFARARELIDAAHSARPEQSGRRASGGACLRGQYGELGGPARRWTPVPSCSSPRAASISNAGPFRSEVISRSARRATCPGADPCTRSRRNGLVSCSSQAGVSDRPRPPTSATWVSKAHLKTNPGTQVLEDAAVLVFLESEIGAFAAQHGDYPREKFVDILKKTWKKMSPRAQELARGLDLPESISGLVRDALA